jgi:hypothetical protein
VRRKSLFSAPSLKKALPASLHLKMEGKYKVVPFFFLREGGMCFRLKPCCKIIFFLVFNRKKIQNPLIKLIQGACLDKVKT